MTNANIVTIAGRPHDIRCPQSGRTDVSDCCKPMVAFTATTEERERCAQIVNEWAKAYPVSMFGNPEDGKHGPTVDSCSAKALRITLPVIAEEIRGHELDSTEKQICECQGHGHLPSCEIGKRLPGSDAFECGESSLDG